MLSMVVMYIIIHANLIITNNKLFIPHQNRQALFELQTELMIQNFSQFFYNVLHYSRSFLLFLTSLQFNIPHKIFKVNIHFYSLHRLFF